MRSAVGGQAEPFKAVLEASYGWGPMYDWFDEVAEEVILAHPLLHLSTAEGHRG